MLTSADSFSISALVPFPLPVPVLIFRIAPWLCFLCFLARVSPVDAARVKWEVSGSGFEDHPSLPELKRHAGEAASEALGRLHVELGIEKGSLPIRWLLDCNDATGNERSPRFFQLGSTSFVEGSVLVRLPVKKYLYAPESVRQVATHEAVHAALASARGSRRRYQAVPYWFREGMALLFSGEGDIVLSERIAYTVYEGRPSTSFLKGLPPPGFQGGATFGFSVSPAEGYLATLWIRERIGAVGFRALCSQVAKGGELDSLLAVLLGSSHEALRAEALRDARTKITETLPPGRERAFQEALAARSRGAGQEAARVLSEILGQERRGQDRRRPLAGTVHYLLARQALDDGHKPEARRHLEDLLELPGTLWRPETLVLLGELLWSAGKKEEAQLRWQEVLVVFGEDRVPAERARGNLARRNRTLER